MKINSHLRLEVAVDVVLVLQVLERQDDAGGVETRVAFGDGAADAGQVVKELAAITVSMHMYCKQNKTRRQSNRPYEKKKTHQNPRVLKSRDEPDQKKGIAVLHDVPAFVQQTHVG